MRNVSGRTVEAVCDDISSLCLVKECGVAFTEKILGRELMWDRRMKDEIRRVDHEESLRRCAEKAPLIAEVEKRVSWVKLQDTVLCSTQEAFRH